MKLRLLKAVRTIEEFDEKLFSDYGIGVELQDFTEPCLSDYEVFKTVLAYEKKLFNFSACTALHGSFLDMDIASFNRDIAKYSERMYLRDLFFAKVLDIDYVIFHANIKACANKTAHDYFMNLQKDFFDKAIDATGFKGTVVLENVTEKNPNLILTLVEKINHPQVKINLDIGHAKLSEVGIEKWIADTKNFLAYMHLHTNDCVEDLHAPISSTEAKDIFSILAKYNCNVPISLEYWNCNILDEVNKLKGIWND